MLRSLRSIWRYGMGASLQILPPRRSSILVFDGMNRHLLAPMLESWNPEILYLRGEVLNLYCLACSFFRRGRLRDAYIDSYVEAVSPRLIVTLFDNDTQFHVLSARHPKIKTMFIQNGWRSYYSDVFEALDHRSPKNLKSARVDYMLVFGRHVGEEYARHIKGQIILHGSYKNNSIPKFGVRQPELIAFISQYHESGIELNGKQMSHNEFFYKPDKLVLEALSQYARANNKRLLIIPRYRKVQKPEREREECYYRQLLGAEVGLLEPTSENSSYVAVDIAGVSVAIDSTLGYESLARGNRTAMFTIRGVFSGLKGYTFGWPANLAETGFFWTNRAQVTEFYGILDRLYAATDKQWQAELAACGIDELTFSDPGNLILQNILYEELGSPT